MKLHSSLEIDRPAAEVFAVISDFSRNPEWQRGMRSAVWTSEPPIAVGSTYDQVARFLGRDVVTSFRVTGYEPGRSIAIESTTSSFPIRVTRSVEALGPGRSRVVADIEGRPGRFFRLFGPLLRALASRSVRGDYRRLRDLLDPTTAAGTLPGMSDEKTEKLRAVPIFAALDDDGLARVAALAAEFEAPPGHVLVEIGHAGTGLFVIEEGTVRVDLPSGKELFRGPGDFFGELAVLADTPRTARVAAVTQLRALAIRRDDLSALLESEPSIAVAMLRELARRLVETA